MYAQKKECDTKIYGIGNSIKCVYYLDDSVIDGLIAIDGYSMGYHSANRNFKSAEKSSVYD